MSIQQTPTKIPRYLPSYRENALHHICTCAREGNSLNFVGVAGSGKSNITDLLRYDLHNYKPRYLNNHVETVHFPRVDIPEWDGTPAELWEMMLEDLIEVTKHLEQPQNPDTKVLSLQNRDERALARLRTRVKWVCQDLRHTVMFMLDDIDRILMSGPVDMLETLYNLRARGNKGYLSYLLFTKKMPHVLGREFELDGKVKFYDLITSNIYVLGLYNDIDARQMLLYLNAQSLTPLTRDELLLIQSLGGGHSGIIKAVYTSWQRLRPSSPIDVRDFYSNSPDILRECSRVFENLHGHEQEVALRVAKNKDTPDDKVMIQFLCARGLITGDNPYRWFSKLFEIFLQ